MSRHRPSRTGLFPLDFGLPQLDASAALPRPPRTGPHRAQGQALRPDPRRPQPETPAGATRQGLRQELHERDATHRLPSAPERVRGHVLQADTQRETSPILEDAQRDQTSETSFPEIARWIPVPDEGIEEDAAEVQAAAVVLHVLPGCPSMEGPRLEVLAAVGEGRVVLDSGLVFLSLRDVLQAAPVREEDPPSVALPGLGQEETLQVDPRQHPHRAGVQLRVLRRQPSRVFPSFALELLVTDLPVYTLSKAFVSEDGEFLF